MMRRQLRRIAIWQMQRRFLDCRSEILRGIMQPKTSDKDVVTGGFMYPANPGSGTPRVVPALGYDSNGIASTSCHDTDDLPGRLA